MQRVVVIFRGRVQGVGFRQTAVDIAERFEVTGTVQNLPDGAVELIAEGRGEELDAFLTAIERRMQRNIDKIIRRSEPPTGSLGDFSVLR